MDRRFHIHASPTEVIRTKKWPSCEHGICTNMALNSQIADTSRVSLSGCWKQKREEKCCNEKCKVLQAVPTELITEKSTGDLFGQTIILLILQWQKNSLLTISISSWAHRHGNTPQQESKKGQCVWGGSYELCINPSWVSYFDWPITNYIWSVTKLPLFPSNIMWITRYLSARCPSAATRRMKDFNVCLRKLTSDYAVCVCVCERES